MCGRYALCGPSSRMREQFGVEPDDRKTGVCHRFCVSPVLRITPGYRAPCRAALGLRL